jgi:hypothetical protein
MFRLPARALSAPVPRHVGQALQGHAIDLHLNAHYEAIEVSNAYCCYTLLSSVLYYEAAPSSNRATVAGAKVLGGFMLCIYFAAANMPRIAHC